jgi:hypothetical protein
MKSCWRKLAGGVRLRPVHFDQFRMRRVEGDEFRVEGIRGVASDVSMFSGFPPENWFQIYLTTWRTDSDDTYREYYERVGLPVPDDDDEDDE